MSNVDNSQTNKNIDVESLLKDDNIIAFLDLFTNFQANGNLNFFLTTDDSFLVNYGDKSIHISHIEKTKIQDFLTNKRIIKKEGENYKIEDITIIEKIKEILNKRGINSKSVKEEIRKIIEKRENFIDLARKFPLKDEYFSDNYNFPQLLNYVKGLVFKRIWITKKTQRRYTIYTLRKWPFDSKKIIINTIFSLLLDKNKSKIEEKSEAYVLWLLALEPNYSLTLDVIKRNSRITITNTELHQIIDSLKAKDLVTISDDKIVVPDYSREFVKEFIKFYYHNYLKFSIIHEIKGRILSHSHSKTLFLISLEPLLIAKKLIFQCKNEICEKFDVRMRIISKKDLENFINEYGSKSIEIRETIDLLLKFKILYDFNDKIVIIEDIIEEIEKDIGKVISTKKAFLILRGDKKAYRKLISIVLKNCKDEVYIHDPYLDKKAIIFLEKLFEELESKELSVKIKFITSENPFSHRVKVKEKEVREVIERIENLMRQKKFEIKFIGLKDDGKSPMHDRFILSKNFAISLGGSLNNFIEPKRTVLVYKIEDEKERKNLEMLIRMFWEKGKFFDEWKNEIIGK